MQLSQGLDCGGAYLKVLEATEGYDPKDLDSSTPYIVMFGPDKCGGTNKVCSKQWHPVVSCLLSLLAELGCMQRGQVHFILRHKNPVNGVWEEKHANNMPAVKFGTSAVCGRRFAWVATCTMQQSRSPAPHLPPRRQADAPLHAGHSPRQLVLRAD